MSYSNQKSCLLSDSFSNLYNFLWDKDKITLIYFDKARGKVEKKTLVENCLAEFDATIDAKDHISMVCQKKDGTILLLSYMYGTWGTETLVDATSENTKAYNINIVSESDRLHVIFCLRAIEDTNSYRIYHYYRSMKKWKINEVQDVRTKGILNAFQVIKLRNQVVLTYYSLVNQIEQIWLKTFNLHTNQWEQSIQLTNSPYDKLYLDIYMSHTNTCHITYSSYEDGNFIVKHEKYLLKESGAEKHLDQALSNPANCSYPTFIAQNNRFWVVWTEYENICSSYSDDLGESWDGPYQWNESKSSLILRYKFGTNDGNIKKTYHFNYTFGKAYPDIEFVGFGPLENAKKIPLKNKKKDISDDAMVTEEKKDSDKSIVKTDNQDKNNANTNQRYLDPRYMIRRNRELYDDIDDEGEDGKGMEEKRKTKTIRDASSEDLDKVQDELHKLDSRLKILEEYFKEVENLRAWLKASNKSQSYKLLEERIEKLEQHGKNEGHRKQSMMDEEQLEELREVKERLQSIENFLNRRRRTPLFPPR